MHRDEWKAVDSASRSAGWRFGVWTLAIVLFFGALTAGIWWFKVATSDVRGAGDATQKINSGPNRIAAQETFEALFQQIQTYDRNLDQAAKDKAEHPGSEFYATNYSGLIKQCNDAVGQYNADARKVSRAKWLTEDLPFEIDLNNPLTDCKETAR